MVPIVSEQGLSSFELKKLINNRDVYIWGYSELGHDVLVSLGYCDIKPKAFISSTVNRKEIYNIPILNSKDILNKKDDAFIIIASRGYLKTAEEECRKSYFVKNKDYMTYYSISRPEAAIDVVKTNNGINIQLSLSDYKEIVNKLFHDRRNYVNVTLGLWKDPLLNDNIIDMVKYMNSFAPCTIVTSLSRKVDLKKVIYSGARKIEIKIYGNKDKYEEKEGKGKWDVLIYNLKELKEILIDNKLKVDILLRYLNFKNDPYDTIKVLKEIIGDSRIEFHAELPYVEPYDKLLRYCENDETSEEIADLNWSLDKALEFSLKDKGKSCLCQRIFPIVNADKSVGFCHLYTNEKLFSNYLSIQWDEIVSKRSINEQCKMCQKYGLHRLDIAVLTSVYPKSYKEIFKERK